MVRLDEDTVLDNGLTPCIKITGGEATTLPGIGMIDLSFMRTPFPELTTTFAKLYISSIGRDERPMEFSKFVDYVREKDQRSGHRFKRNAGGYDVLPEAKYPDLRPADYRLMDAALNMLLRKINAYTPPIQLPAPPAAR